MRQKLKTEPALREKAQQREDEQTRSGGPKDGPKDPRAPDDHAATAR
jgi:hypothetical protein